MTINKSQVALKTASPYTAVETREQFLFFEVRTTAKLVVEGLTPEEIIRKVEDENLFQYPTERTTKSMVRTCLRRLDCLGDESLVKAIVEQPSDVAKQICLYAMMKQYRLVWDFMVTVIGEKYRLLDYRFSKIDLNSFFTRLQEQDDWVATWSDSTIKKLKQVLVRLLVENGYLDNTKSEELMPVLISNILESSIRANEDEAALPAFNCFI